MTDGNAQSIDAWTAYWRTGRGASCFDGSDMEVRLTHLWNEFADLLPDRARLLDLATGNGTVARICAARARSRRITLQIDAVDAAAIDPDKYARPTALNLREIRFHAGVRLESLPFADESFDGVVSQFGFEYADEAAAASEAVRVLAPGGRLRLVIHARDGAISQDIGRRLERLRGVLAEKGPAALVLALARAAEAGDDAAVKRESEHLAGAAARVRQLSLDPPPEDAALFYAREFLELWLLRGRYRRPDLRRSVEDGWMNAKGVAIRQEQMLEVARSSEQMAALSARLTALGLTVDQAFAIRDQRRGVQIAWLLTARKPVK